MSTFLWACFFGCYIDSLHNESFDKYKTYHKSPAEDETAFLTGKNPNLFLFFRGLSIGSTKTKKKKKKRHSAKEILQGLKH